MAVLCACELCMCMCVSVFVRLHMCRHRGRESLSPPASASDSLLLLDLALETTRLGCIASMDDGGGSVRCSDILVLDFVG